MPSIAYAGDRVSAAQQTFIAGIGEEALNLTFDTNSATWNTGTHVLSNMVGTYTAVNAGIYDVTAEAHVQATGAATYGTLGIAFRQGGAAVNTDPLCGGPAAHRLETVGAPYHMTLSGRIVASANTTMGIAVVGWIGLGGATVGIVGAAATHINHLKVVRIG